MHTQEGKKNDHGPPNGPPNLPLHLKMYANFTHQCDVSAREQLWKNVLCPPENLLWGQRHHESATAACGIALQG